jgi:predicted DCC family thiol-disulfide oxidoreductase YuxK
MSSAFCSIDSPEPPAPSPIPPERWYNNLITLDLRSIALFRIMLGIVTLASQIQLIGDITPFFTDDGVISRSALIASYLGPSQWSIHLASGKWLFQFGLIVASIICALLYTVGFQAKRCGILMWLIIISQHTRNPAILSGADVVHRLAIFWSLFLPLSARASLDRLLSSNPPPIENRYVSWRTLGILLQIASIYLVSAALKTAPEWRSEFSALYYTLNLDMFATSLGIWLRQFRGLLTGLTMGAFALEVSAPLWIFAPFANSAFRKIGVLYFTIFHFSLFLTMYLGMFPWICITAWLIVLPGSFWDSIHRRIRRRGAGLTIAYDGDCGFCKVAVYALRSMLLIEDAHIIPADMRPDLLAVMQRENSWVIQSGSNEPCTAYDGFLELLQASPLGIRPFHWLLSRSLSRLVGNGLYRWVAGNRPRLSGLISRPKAAPSVPRHSRLGTALCLYCIGLMLTNNLASMHIGERALNARWIFMQRAAIRLDQYWNMFAPSPLKEDGWFILEAELLDQSTIDPLHDGAPPNFERPDSIAEQYQNSRWRKFLSGLARKENRSNLMLYAKYVCRDWNNNNEPIKAMQWFSIFHMKEMTRLAGPEPIKRTPIWTQYCSDSTPPRSGAPTPSESVNQSHEKSSPAKNTAKKKSKSKDKESANK